MFSESQYLRTVNPRICMQGEGARMPCSRRNSRGVLLIGLLAYQKATGSNNPWPWRSEAAVLIGQAANSRFDLHLLQYVCVFARWFLTKIENALTTGSSNTLNLAGRPSTALKSNFRVLAMPLSWMCISFMGLKDFPTQSKSFEAIVLSSQECMEHEITKNSPLKYRPSWSRLHTSLITEF